MQFNLRYLFILFSFSMLLVNCSSDDGGGLITDDDDPVEVSPVIFNIDEVPYENLSDYNFFKSPMSDLEPVFGVLPFQPAAQLFTDYAKKKRFVWMPEDVSASYQGDGEVLNFPVGTVLIKNFYYENMLPDNSKKIIETRLLIKKPEGWIFADYVWNDDQTEATYNMDGSFKPIQWVQDGETKSANYRIPSGSECITCHGLNESPMPLGTKPQSLNFAIGYSDGIQNQLQKMKNFGYISNEIPSNIVSVVDYNDASQPLDLRARSYLDINCASCHRDGGYSQLYPVRYTFTQSADYNALGFCKQPEININGMIYPEEADHIVYKGDHTKSVIYYRMNATLEDGPLMMPYIGRSIIHEEGISLINQWIDSFEQGCD